MCPQVLAQLCECLTTDSAGVRPEPVVFVDVMLQLDPGAELFVTAVTLILALLHQDPAVPSHMDCQVALEAGLSREGLATLLPGGCRTPCTGW